jgi:hypothetical protein
MPGGGAVIAWFSMIAAPAAGFELCTLARDGGVRRHGAGMERSPSIHYGNRIGELEITVQVARMCRVSSSSSHCDFNTKVTKGQPARRSTPVLIRQSSIRTARIWPQHTRSFEGSDVGRARQADAPADAARLADDRRSYPMTRSIPPRALIDRRSPRPISTNRRSRSVRRRSTRPDQPDPPTSSRRSTDRRSPRNVTMGQTVAASFFKR